MLLFLRQQTEELYARAVTWVHFNISLGPKCAELGQGVALAGRTGERGCEIMLQSDVLRAPAVKGLMGVSNEGVLVRQGEWGVSISFPADLIVLAMVSGTRYTWDPLGSAPMGQKMGSFEYVMRLG